MASIYTIYDEVKNIHFVLEIFENDRDCKRTMVSRYVSGALDRIPDLKDYPNQFIVKKLADFDSYSGKITPIEPYDLLNFRTCCNDEGERQLISV